MIGEVLGKYRVLSRIGDGGMGVVYRAEHTLIGRIAAVKVLRPEMSRDRDHVRRFFNEARAAASLHHPGLVDVYDYGHRSDGTAYIIMEFLGGESLAQRLSRLGRQPIDVALAITRQAASALHALHEQGIIHRDLKPGNIFLLADSSAPGGVRTKVLDLGIAKLTGVRAGSEDSSATTAHGGLFGTPRYMAPEQCKNASDVDGRADVYSLGCILFEMLLGRAPFTYQNWGELVAAHIHERPPRPRDLDPDLPQEIENVVLKALAKVIDDRYSMSELATATETVWRDMMGSAPQPRFTPLPQATDAEATRLRGPKPTPSVAAQVEELAPAPRGSRLRIAVVGVALAAVAAAITLRVLGGDRTESSTPVAIEAAPAPVVTPLPPAITEVHQAPAAAIASDAGVVAEPTTVELVVDSIPQGAYVYRASDGVRLGQTPLRRTFARTDGMADFVVKLSGYRDRRVSLSTREDGTVATKLELVPHPERAPARRPPTVQPTVLDPYGAP